MPGTVIITPVANEAPTIERQVRLIHALGIPDMEAVFISDDHSRDGTRAILQALARELPWVREEFFSGSTGVVSCYLYGLRRALELGADRIIEMDGGLSHDPALLPLFIKKLEEWYDCVFGSRFITDGGFKDLPWHRSLISGGGTWLANAWLGTRLTDMTSGYEAFRRDVLIRLPLDDFLSVRTTHFYQTEMRFYCHRLKWCEVPIVFRGSTTSFTFREIYRSLSALGELRQRLPLPA